MNYHPGKANVVENALSRKSLHISTMMVRELEMIEHFRDLSLVYEVTSNSVKLGMWKLTIGFLEEIKEKQRLDLALVDRQTLVGQGNDKDFQIDENGILKFRGRVCVSNVPEFKRMILEESHEISLRR